MLLEGMETNQLNKLSRVQLEQMIIHLKSEVSKNKLQLIEYEQDMSHRRIMELKRNYSKLLTDVKNYQEQFKKNEEEETMLLAKVEALENEKKKSISEINKINNKYEKDMKQYQTVIKEWKIKYEKDMEQFQSEINDWKAKYEKDMENFQSEINEWKTNNEKEMDKIEMINKESKRKDKQKSFQNEIQEIMFALAEEISEVQTKSPKNEKRQQKENKEKLIKLMEDLRMEKDKRLKLQKELVEIENELFFLQKNVDKEKLKKIDILVPQITKVGNGISESSIIINKLEREIELLRN